jgi:hypothetical protein
MKKLFITIAAIAVLAAGYFFGQKPDSQMAGGERFNYKESTQATASAGLYGWTSVLSADSGRQYATICNNSIVANDSVYLYFGTASTTAVSPTRPNGYRLASGACYEMTNDKLYFGPVYAIASTATTTLLTVSANNY